MISKFMICNINFSHFNKISIHYFINFSSSTADRQPPVATEPSQKTVIVEEHDTSSSSSSSSDSSDSDSNEHAQQRESTYVEEEVNKFRSMANLWWDPNGDAKPLHSLNMLRYFTIFYIYF